MSHGPVPRLVSLSVRRPRAVLALTLVAAALALLFVARNFAMTTDTAALISPDVAWRQQEQATENAFPQLRDAMLVVIDGQTPELAERAAARLTARLAADRRHFRLVRRPDGGDFFAREGLLFSSLPEVRATTSALIDAQPLLGPLAADPSLRGVASALSTMLDGVEAGSTDLGKIDPAMRALDRTMGGVLAGRPIPFSWYRLFEAQGGLAAPERRLILAQPVLDHEALMPGEAASAAVFAAARAEQLDPMRGATVRLTGEVPLADEEFATLNENIGAVGVLMLAAMLLTLWLATRSVRLVAALLLTVVAGLIVTTALGLAAVGRLNLISVAFIPLFVGLGVDFGIQLGVRFNAERRAGLAPSAALEAAATALGAPLSLAAGAVFLGFAAFLPTAYIGIAELGVISGLGMIVALLFSVTLLPAAILLFTPPLPREEVGFAQLAPVDRFLERRRSAVLWAFAISLVVSIALLPWVRFDFNPLHLRDPNAPAMRTLSDLTRDPDRTPNTIDVLAPDPAAAAALARRLERIAEVGRVVTVDSFVPADQPAKLALISDAQMLLDLTLNPFDVAPPPRDPELVSALRQTAAKLRAVAGGKADPASADARRLAQTFERLAGATPKQRAQANAALAEPLGVMLDGVRALLQAEPITRETLPPAIVRDYVAPNGLTRIQLFPRGDANDNRVLQRFRAAVERLTPSVSGLPVATQKAASTVAGAFIQAGVIALALIGLLLFAVLRSMREVAFTLAPVVLSIFLTLASCVLIGLPINFANIIAFPLLLGVGVAFHIYFVMAWRAGAHDLLQSSLARAVLFSALATGSAFGSLWLSRHPGTASMGEILLVSLVWTLICALIFEPALLGPQRKPSPA
ncbi:MAG TPA: MMPL family transporter [Sphingomonas sp.]|nr:MMPL family transporter [Sphingomonas sp.]